MTAIVRTRFAPSPTGYLHIGSVRTALYAWLYARHHGGQFILRIEDTDVERSTEASVTAILEGMQWLGLNWDEGPFFQTKRLDRYREVANKMLADGHAYRCYCSKERLEALRAEQMQEKRKPRYDGHCRDLAPRNTDEPFVIRFRNPGEGMVSFHDQVFGEMVFQMDELDDLIIVRSNGMPTYNFSVVVDDYDMQITHVIRGDDHLNNTPRQILILQALGATIPVYAHLPMILGADGKRFSKRHGAVSVLQYQEDGFLPHALLNYLARLGWSHGDQEIFSLAELIEFFNLSNVQKSPAAFNNEKLLWLNQHYIKTTAPQALLAAMRWQLQQFGISDPAEHILTAVIAAQSERAKTLKEMAEKSLFFFQDIIVDAEIKAKHLSEESLPALQALFTALQSLTEWQKENIHHALNEVAEKFQLKLGKIAQPLRVAITGGTVSPPIDVTLEILGKEKVLQRLKQFLA